jgi:Family of unknown function (DUF6508)
MNGSALQSLAEFNERLCMPGVQFGDWESAEKDAAGVFEMPYVRYSGLATEFAKAAYENDWVQPQFDWMAWYASPEHQALVQEPDGLIMATSDQLAQLLTVCLRRERFFEGSLLQAFESGLIQRIVSRAIVILHTEVERR